MDKCDSWSSVFACVCAMCMHMRSKCQYGQLDLVVYAWKIRGPHRHWLRVLYRILHHTTPHHVNISMLKIE